MKETHSSPIFWRNGFPEPGIQCVMNILQSRARLQVLWSIVSLASVKVINLFPLMDGPLKGQENSFMRRKIPASSQNVTAVPVFIKIRL